MRVPRPRTIAVLLAAAAAAAPAIAVTCEEVRASIEERIRANGVADFTVSVVDAAASAPGQMVGNCGLGTKKIMYERHLQEAEPAAAPRARKAASAAQTGKPAR